MGIIYWPTVDCLHREVNFFPATVEAIQNPMARISYWDGPALFLLRRDGPGRALVRRAKAEKQILTTSGWSIAQARVNVEVADVGQIDDWEQFVSDHFRRGRDQRPNPNLDVPDDISVPMTTAIIVSASRFVTGDYEIEKHFALCPFHGLYVISLINFARDLDGGGMWTPETLCGGQPFTLRFTAPELFRRTQKRGRKPRG